MPHPGVQIEQTFSGKGRAAGKLLAVIFFFSPFLPFALSPTPTCAQRVRVYVSVDSVSVGERFTLSLVAEHGFMSDVTFPDPAADSAAFGDVVVLERLASGYRYGGTARPGVRIDSVAYAVTTFALDSARVPPLPVRFSARGDTVQAASAALVVPVRSVVPPDAQGLRGLASPAPFPRSLWRWVFLGLLVLFAAGGGYYLWRKHRAASSALPSQPPPAPPVSPYEEARRRLRRLETIADPAAAKPFFTELADALRLYLDRRLEVAARERTTRELMQVLRPHPDLPGSTLRRLRVVLEQADLVKFADAHPPPETSYALLVEARTVLEDIETALRPPPPEPAAPHSEETPSAHHA